jgi:hypothetical protein
MHIYRRRSSDKRNDDNSHTRIQLNSRNYLCRLISSQLHADSRATRFRPSRCRRPSTALQPLSQRTRTRVNSTERTPLSYLLCSSRTHSLHVVQRRSSRVE